MDKLSVMRAFCRIVERGSFAKAAEDLQVSPALLSSDLKRLEQQLGCALLARTTRRMSLTEHGRLYYEEAKRILADIDRSEEAVRQAAGQVRGRLSVNAPHSFGVTVLASLLPSFLARHPEVDLSVSFDDRVIDMIEGGYDLTIRIRAGLPDSGLVARGIAPVRQALFASPAHLARHGTPQRTQDLASHPVVGYLHADDATAWILHGPEGAVTLPHRARLKVGSSLVLRDLLIAGNGIGALPDFLSDPAEREGRLVRVLPRHALPSRHVYAVSASRRSVDAKALAFVDHLQAALARPRHDS
ncbi:LysR substrate-binding domain-containing protein [Burkholderiaceae bacterium FT117]|uniref:LysR family transcriptional regulator n=1 Tax=Zeimonas sediminis TaxID=2944268 RepID=UPI002342FF44|nr:LysR family transcriptional regulator [Zeimonas sediminis]MCM5569354.1 LysR substrate-binding domain-containing protein [Zeimonas sediminis]